MERIARKMGIERLSKDQISAVCRSLDAGVAELVSRDLGGVGFPCLILNATYVRCRRDDRVQSTTVVAAIDIGSDGVRHVLDVAAIDTETHASWLGFLSVLRGRRLTTLRASSATCTPCRPRGATGRRPARGCRASSASRTPPP